MPGAWERFWAEINTPSAQDGWYAWASNQAGHAVIGAALACVLILAGGAGWYAWLFGVASYTLWKEFNDVHRGGDRRDGLTDVLFFALGCLHMVVDWWPVVAVAGLGVGVVLRLRNE